MAPESHTGYKLQYPIAYSTDKPPGNAAAACRGINDRPGAAAASPKNSGKHAFFSMLRACTAFMVVKNRCTVPGKQNRGIKLLHTDAVSLYTDLKPGLRGTKPMRTDSKLN
jgi:hypothetical protein